MHCKISCSFGEVIDKITILRIKEKKANLEALKNIKKEINAIIKDNPVSRKNDELFDRLYKTNQRLWILEDLIRQKSTKKEFDKKYIEYAEQIHKTNDLRYLIKKEINEKYNSLLKEEKFYNLLVDNDKILLEKGKMEYTNGNYKNSLSIIESLINKYNNYNIYDEFYVDLLFSYKNIHSIYYDTFPLFHVLTSIIENIENLLLSNALKEHCIMMYVMACLSHYKYKQSYPYLNFFGSIIGPNVNKYNMSFFEKNSVNKSLLIYEGGGLGDIIMNSRFIPKLCETQKNNKIIFIVHNRLKWLIEKTFKYENLIIISDKNIERNILPFDHHCSLISLLKYLEYDYDTIPFFPLFENIEIVPNKICCDIIKSNSNKTTYILNWKGNSQNIQEKHNRMMDLKYAIPLFQIENIHWLVITPEISREERKVLEKYNVHYIGNKIDKVYGFQDSISLMQSVKGVISTDTSIVHLSANLNVTTYVLLTKGCEWRWSSHETTKWYPQITLCRQKKQNEWKNVIDYVKTKIIK